MEGVLLIDKPSGWTSFDVVNYVRKIVARAEDKKPKNVKVGHTGTLDPLATGLLVLLIGKSYTRRAGEFSKLDKTYEAEMTLGATSSTGDADGEKHKISARHPSPADITSVLAKFTGKIMQTPPAYSAIKFNGKRAYELARKGETPMLEPRPVEIYKIELTNYEYPIATFTSDVSSGTYIRSLVESIGDALGTGAYTSSLRRISVGNLSIANAIDVTDESLLKKVIPL